MHVPQDRPTLDPIAVCLLQIGTGVTNLLITARKAIDKSFAGEAEDVPILSTSAAYGVYMSVSSNLRYAIWNLSRLCSLLYDATRGNSPFL